VNGRIVSIAATAIAFIILAYIVPQVTFTGGVVQLIVLAAIFGVVNGVIKPAIRMLAFPINAMTLGLFGLVINAALLLLVAWIGSTIFKVGFEIGGFPSHGLSIDAFVGAFIAGIVLTIIQAVVGLVIKDR